MDASPEILVVYPQADSSPCRIEEILARRGIDYAAVELRAFAEGQRPLSFRIGPSHLPEFRFQDARTHCSVSTSAVRAVWVEGLDFGLDEPEWSGKIQDIPQYLRTLGHYETLALLYSFLAEVTSHRVTLPQIFEGSRAGHRLAQMTAAREAGFAIPRTYAGLSTRSMIEWLKPDAADQLHYRPLTAFRFELRGRRFLTVERQISTDSRFALRHLTSPAMFSVWPASTQRYLVAVLPNDLFALEARLKDPQQNPDVTDLIYQHTQGNLDIVPVELPDDMRQPCIRLMRQLGLQYGALDLLRETENTGRCLFLSLNPFARPLLFEEAGFPIYERLLEALLP